MQLDARSGGRCVAAELQQLSYDVVDAAEFAPNDLGEFGVLVFFEQQINKGFDGDERVLDFMRHAGGKSADGGESVEAFNNLLESREARDVCECENDEVVTRNGYGYGTDLKRARRTDACGDLD